MKNLEVIQLVVAVVVIVLSALGLLGAALVSLAGVVTISPILWVGSFIAFFIGLFFSSLDFEKIAE